MDYSIRQRLKDEGYDPDEIENRDWELAEASNDDRRDRHAEEEIND